MRLYDQFSAVIMNWAQNDLLPAARQHDEQRCYDRAETC